jgi:hypothetical protein
VDGEHGAGDRSGDRSAEVTKKKVAPAFAAGDAIRVGKYNGRDTGKEGAVLSTQGETAIAHLRDGRDVRFQFSQLVRR